MKKDDFASVLRFLLELVEGMSEEEFRALKKGELRLAGPEKSTRAKQREVETQYDFSGIIAALNDFDSESEALAFLASHPGLKTKEKLLQLALDAGVPVAKSLRKAEIQQAIVRCCVGRRLQSQAISRVTAHE